MAIFYGMMTGLVYLAAIYACDYATKTGKQMEDLKYNKKEHERLRKLELKEKLIYKLGLNKTNIYSLKSN